MVQGVNRAFRRRSAFSACSLTLGLFSIFSATPSSLCFSMRFCQSPPTPSGKNFSVATTSARIPRHRNLSLIVGWFPLIVAIRRSTAFTIFSFRRRKTVVHFAK